MSEPEGPRDPDGRKAALGIILLAGLFGAAAAARPAAARTFVAALAGIQAAGGVFLLWRIRRLPDRRSPDSPGTQESAAAEASNAVRTVGASDAATAEGIGYLEGRPAWFVKVVHPTRFRKVRHDIEFKTFPFPTSALVAVLLRFFDDDSNPYCFHRVFDLADAPTSRYLRQVAADGEWLVVVNGRGTEDGFSRGIPVLGQALPASLAAARKHVDCLARVDGRAAVGEFLRIFKAEGEKGGFHAGWTAVSGWLEKQRT